MPQSLYPKYKPPKQRKVKPWRVQYELFYGYTMSEFTRYYRWKTTAKLFAFWHYYIRSYGGSAVLFGPNED